MRARIKKKNCLPHLAISNCKSKAAVKPTQLHRPAIFFQSFKDPSSRQRAKPFRKFKIVLISRSCRSSCGPLRSCYLPDRFWNSGSTLRNKIFCTSCFRAAITLMAQKIELVFWLPREIIKQAFRNAGTAGKSACAPTSPRCSGEM